MEIQVKTILPPTDIGSGGVTQFTLPKGRKVTQITTFTPVIDGPGPTNVYLIEADILILVDTGIPTGLLKEIFFSWRRKSIPYQMKKLSSDYSEKELVKGINAAGYSLRDIDLLLITHGHPDHYLLGNKIIELSGAKVLAHILDTELICNPWNFIDKEVKLWEKTLVTGMPMPEGRLPELMKIIMAQPNGLSLTVDHVILSDGPLTAIGHKIDWIEVRNLPGHTPGGLGFVLGTDLEEERVIICGDTLLHSISPHPDDLVDYLATLKTLKLIKGVSLALPGHGNPIESLTPRVNFLESHHHRRLKLTYDYCRNPKSVWQISTLPGYFDLPVDPEKFNPLAATETLVHLELLEKAGGIYRPKSSGDVLYFQNKGYLFEEVYEKVIEIVEKRRQNRFLWMHI